MTLAEIRALPTTLDCGPNNKRFHESCFRSYHIVVKIRELVDQGSPDLLSQIIDDLQTAPQKDLESEPFPVPAREPGAVEF